MPRRPYNAKEKIIQSLSKGPSVWSQLRKDTGLSEAALSTNLKILMNEYLVKKSKDGYILTFIGVVRYLFRHFRDEKFGVADIRKVIEKYGSIDYVLFTEHQYLEGWLGNEYYDLLFSSAYATYQELMSRFQIIWTKAVTPIKRGEKVAVAGIQLPSLEEVEAEWIRMNALWFFNLLLAKPERKLEPPSNPRIRALIKETYEDEISLRKESLLNLENIKQRLLGHS